MPASGGQSLRIPAAVPVRSGTVSGSRVTAENADFSAISGPPTAALIPRNWYKEHVGIVLLSTKKRSAA